MTRSPRAAAWSFLKRPRIEREVDDELAFHVDMEIQMLVADGMSSPDARAEAVRRFGDMAVVAAECRRFGRQRDRIRSRAEYLSELKQDVAFAVRQLGRARAFAATATITLALGIGATAAVFSALYAVVLRPLPFADPNRVVQVLPTRRGEVGEIVSGAEFAAIRDRHDAFAMVAAAVTGGAFTRTGTDEPETINASRVTADYFRVLGVSPALGRGFLAADDQPGAPHVVLMSHRLWVKRFASEASVVGRTVRLEDEPYTIVGVLPEAFDGARLEADMWAPLGLTTQQLNGDGGQWLRVVARLAPGVTLAQASDAAKAAETVVARRTPGAPQEVGAVVQRYIDGVVGTLRERLLVLFGAVGFVLLIACVNVANLLLARGTVRARELAIRAALGAGRARLVRQLLVESLVIALGGAAIGVVLAVGLVKALVALGPEDARRLHQTSVDGIVVAFTLGAAVISSVLAGLVPAFRSASPALQSALREGGRGSGAAGTRDRVRAMLVAAEVALAMTLLTGSGLLIRTAWRLQHVNPGFSPSRVMTTRLALPAARYADAAGVARTYEQIREAVSRVPGVEQSALASVVPLSGSTMNTRVAPEGGELAPDERVGTDIRYVSPEYFAAMGISLLDGRDLARTDGPEAPQVVVISASLARALWPGDRAVGKRVDGMRLARGVPNLITVAGVVADVHDAALDAPATPTMYMPFTQTPAGMWSVMSRSMVLVDKTTPPPETLVRSIRKAVMSVDPSLPLLDEHSMKDWLSRSVASARFNTLLLATLAALALLLASVGVYGVVSYYVSQRTREIGVRIALGAKPRDIWRLVLNRGLWPIAWGIVAGAALSLTTARLLREELYGVSPTDPATFVAVAAALLAVAVVATFIPARRAMRLTPSLALAAE